MIVETHESIDISDDIHSLVYKRFVQVNNPRKIDPRVLESYIKGENQKNLILNHGESSTKGSIVAIYHDYLVAELLENGFKLEKGDKVLVVLDHLSYNTVFTLQTMVNKKFFSEVWLKYLDPRFENRYKFQIKNGLMFYLIPVAIYTLIESTQVHIIRQTILGKGSQEGKIIISENIYSGVNSKGTDIKNLDLSNDNFHQEYRNLLESPPIKGSLKDISPGGMCIVVDEEPYEKNSLILAKVEIPPVSSDASGRVCTPLSLQLLASIRGISKTNEGYGLHIGFLKRLETHIADSYFTGLEKYYNRTKEPI